MSYTSVKVIASNTEQNARAYHRVPSHTSSTLSPTTALALTNEIVLHPVASKSPSDAAFRFRKWQAGDEDPVTACAYCGGVPR